MKKKAKEMKKYEVTLYYHTNITVEVMASSEEEAIENAYSEAGKNEYDKMLLDNLQSDDSPDVEEVAEETKYEDTSSPYNPSVEEMIDWRR